MRWLAISSGMEYRVLCASARVEYGIMEGNAYFQRHPLAIFV